MEKNIHKGRHLTKYLDNMPWYLISSISTKLFGLLLLPVYTQFFTKEELGSLATYESLGRMFVVALSLYIDAAFIRYYYKARATNPDKIDVFFSSHFWFIVGWGSVAALLLLFLGPSFIPGLPKASPYLLASLILYHLLSQLVVMLTLIWNANLQAKKVAIFQVSFSLISLLVTLYLILGSEIGWESRIYALLLVSLAQLIFVIRTIVNSNLLVLKFDVGIIKLSLKYCIPLIPNIAAGWIAMFSDRIIMSYFGQLDQVGVYSIAAQLSMILYVVNDSITKIQGPLAMSGLTDNVNEAKTKMVEFVSVYFSLVSLLYCTVLFLLPNIVSILFGDDYVEVTNIFMVLGWVYILSGIYRVFTNIISFHNATWIISLGAIIQASVNILFNLLMIPTYGMYAAAVSTVLSMAVYTGWIYAWSQKLDRLDLNFSYLIRIFVLTLFIIFALFLINHYSLKDGFASIQKLILFCVMVFSFLRLQGKEFRKYLSTRFFRK